MKLFSLQENGAIYSFTAQIENRTITTVLKKKEQAEEEYKSAIEDGRTAILMRQSADTLDTFTVSNISPCLTEMSCANFLLASVALLILF